MRVGDSHTRVWFTGKDDKEPGVRTQRVQARIITELGKTLRTSKTGYNSRVWSDQPRVHMRLKDLGKTAEPKMRDLLSAFIMCDSSSQPVPWGFAELTIE